MKSGRKFVISATLVGVGTLLIAGHLAGIKINTTKSIPVGIYRMVDVPIKTGEYVLFCPPESALFQEAKQRGYIGSGLMCPSQHGYMMKQVAAMEGDVISISQSGVLVNDELLPLTAQLTSDGRGNPLPTFILHDYELPEREVLLLSNVSETSFDGRYFGPIDVSHIRSVVLPVIIKNENSPRY